jgi:carbonic anhydrase/acetyltransferase-like protein (isoleucine patch superfamily)
MLSVVSDRCYLPWNAGIFMTTLMENSMVAQLSCLQMCVVGRNTFIGAGNIFTDFDLQNRPLQTFHKRRDADEAKLEEVGMPVLGSAVGHNVKIGSGFVIYPARMIGSNTTLIYSDEESVVGRNVRHIANADDMEVDEHGEPVRTVYRWPHRLESYDRPDREPMESIQMSLPKAARVRH